MARSILLDKGVYRLIPDLKIEKGKWYLGFICPHCKAKILVLNDPTDGKDPPCATGAGQFSVPCAACRTDEILFGTGDLGPLQADEDGPLPARLKRPKPSNRPRQPIRTRYPKARATHLAPGSSKTGRSAR